MNSPKKREVAITNVFGPLNRGDEELAGTLVSALLARDAAVVGIARDPSETERAFPGAKFFEQPGKFDGRAAPFVRSALLAGFLISPTGRLLPSDQKAGAKALRNADLVLACPGGYLEDSRLSYLSQLMQIAASVRLKKRVVLAPMSIGPVRSRLGRILLRVVLSRCERIFVRDLESQEFLKGLGVGSTYSIDLALSRLNSTTDRLSHAVSRPNPANRKGSVLTALRWPFPTSPDPNAAKSEYVTRCVQVIDLLAERFGGPVRLMVQVGGDREVIDELAAKRPNCEVIEPQNPDEARDLMRSAEVAVASRLHSGVFALQSGTPTAFLAYLPKTMGVARGLGLTHLVWQIEDFDPSELVSTLCEAAAEPESWWADLCASLGSLHSTSSDPFHDWLANELED